MAEHKIRIPDDVMIVGFGDYPFANFLTPPLTTVQLPASEVGAAAIDLLLKGIADRQDQTPPLKQKIAPELIIRASSSR